MKHKTNNSTGFKTTLNFANLLHPNANQSRYLQNRVSRKSPGECSTSQTPNDGTRSPEIPPTLRIFGEAYDEGPEVNPQFKPGQALQLIGGYDLKMTSLKQFGSHIKNFQ